MDVRAKVEKIKALCAKGDGVAALKEILELDEKRLAYMKKESEEEVIVDRATDIEIRLLSIKASLVDVPFVHEELLGNVYKRIAYPFNEVETLEEIGKVESALFDIISEWKKTIIMNSIVKLKNNFTDAVYKEYLNASIGTVKAWLEAELRIRNNENVLRIAEKEGLFKNGKKEGWDEYRKKYLNSENHFTSTKEKALLLDLASRRFEAIKAVIEENSHITKAATLQLAETVLPELYLVKTIFKGETRSKNNDAAMFDKLSAYADVLRYLLEVVVYPDGNAMSLIQGEPRTEYQELVEVYERMALIDGTFTVPPLPNPDGISPAQQASADSANMTGCLTFIFVIVLMAVVIFFALNK